MNPYLTRKREQAEAVRKSIEGLQTRAADEDRDLSDEELRSIEDQGKTYKTMVDEIASLTDIETRAQQVNTLAAQVAGNGGQGAERTTSDAEANDRDPGHYRSAAEGGTRSFFGDLYRQKMGDRDAGRFLDEHNRAMLAQHDRSALTGGNTGVIPPVWMGNLWDEGLRQGRAVANAVRRIPITSPAPMTLPRQNALLAVDDVSESSEPDDSPSFASNTATVTPKAVSGKNTVSRHLLDASSPTVDGLILGDLVGDYNDKTEGKVVTAILAAGPASLPADADEDDPTEALHPVRVALQAAIAVRRNRKNRRADLFVMSISRYGEFLGYTDTTGRPLIPATTVGQAVNVAGIGTVATDGILHGLGIVATSAAEPESISPPLEDVFAAIHAQDVLLFESGVQRFSFEEPKGPEKIILAVWAYNAVHVRYGGAGVQTVDVEESPSV